MFIAYGLFFYCLLFVVCCLLFVVCCVMVVVVWCLVFRCFGVSVFVVCCLVFCVCYLVTRLCYVGFMCSWLCDIYFVMLCVLCFSLFLVRCYVLFVIRCLLFLVYRLLVVSCLLFADCCVRLVCVVWRFGVFGVWCLALGVCGLCLWFVFVVFC